MDKPASAHRRKSQVFVEIPASPLVSSRSGGANPRVQQENTPLKTVAMNVDHPEISTSSPTSNKLKRKSMGAPQSEHEGDGTRPPKSKKPKTDARSKPDATTDTAGMSAKGPKGNKPADSQENTLRCHQCTRQFEPSTVIECTSLRPSGQRCVLKYCKACMRNRYQEDIENLKTNGGAKASAEVPSNHAADLDYVFRCPRCSGNCNCRFCRKAQGLPAIGKAPKTPAPPEDGPKDDADRAVASTSKASPPSKKKAAKKADASGPKPHASKPKPHVLIPPSPHARKGKAAEQVSVVEPPRRRGRPKQQPAPKVLPNPVWTPLPTPLTHNSALQRLNIRECLLRFSHLTDIARGHLEELEELGSDTYGFSDSDDEHSDREGSTLVGWISELALKAIFIGLLSVLSKDPEQEDNASAYTKAIQSIKASGANLNKMWAVLASLPEKTSLALPDPLPPAASTQRHSTRSGLQAQDPSSSSIAVTSTPQLVPVVSALLEHTLQTKAVRDDFERALAQEKDLVRAARELTAEENARWKALMDAKDTTPADKKTARAAHKVALADIDHAQSVAAVECIPRYAPLGRDAEGRVYYALSPGMIEREAAVDLLEGGRGEVRLGKRRGVADEAQRKRMRHWSWLLAVWGRKPEGATVAKRVSDEDDEAEGEDKDAEDEHEDVERWWAFWEPEEVAKLSEWLAMKHGIDLEAKRASKEPEDAAVAHPPAGPEGEGAVPGALDAKGEEKRRGRVSAASSVGNASFAGASRAGVRTFASLNRESEDEAQGVGVGFAGNTSDEEDPDSAMHDDMYGGPAPTKRDLRALAKGLKEYADLLEWRIRRASREVKDGGDAAEKSDKGKKTAAISTQSFYGK